MKKRSQKSGVALLIVLMSLIFMSLFIFQLQYSSAIDFKISKSTRNRLQATYLAHSAARLALLRLQMFKELENLLASSGNNTLSCMVPKEARSQIWAFPLPAFPLQGQESKAPGTFMSIIKGEGSKIPILLLDGNIHRMYNDVVDNDSATTVSLDIRKQIENMIQIKIDEDEKFRDKYSSLEAADYVDALVDWIDADDNGIQSGDEAQVYERRTPPYKPRSDRFSSISEIAMIENWHDDIFNYLKNEVSTINLKAKINCNTISLERLRAYSKNELKDSALALIQKRRMEEPFASLADCENYIRSNPDLDYGRNFSFPDDLKKAGEYDRESVFTIEGSSTVGEARSKVRLFVRFEEDIKAPATPPPSGQPPPTTPPPQGGQSSSTAPTKINELRVIRFEEGAL